jgi:DNA-binding NarL/FixJ family response regulator
MADDHVLIRQSLANMINGMGDCEVIWQASHGLEVQELMARQEPDVLLLDIRMPKMNGFETCAWVSRHHKQVKVLALSMMDEEDAVIRMLRAGARGYLLKDADPLDLAAAIKTVHEKGFFFNDVVSGKLLHQILQENIDAENDPGHQLTPREEEFLKLTCSELTYKEIADIMHLSPRTLDGYRDTLFDKLGVKTRVGLAMYAVKRGLYVP